MIGPVHQQERTDADQPHQRGDDDRNREVGAHRADPWLPAAAHQAERKPMPQDEKIGRAEAEHHRRVAVEPIHQAAPARQRQIFAHRQGIDVANTTALQIARGRVMDGVRAPPEVVWRQGEHAERAADPIVGEAMAEERTVSAIVLDHEQPHQESGGRNGKQQSEPPKAQVIGRPHHHPEQHERPESDAEFEQTASVAGFAVTRKNLGPGARVDCLVPRRRDLVYCPSYCPL